ADVRLVHPRIPRLAEQMPQSDHAFHEIPKDRDRQRGRLFRTEVLARRHSHDHENDKITIRPRYEAEEGRVQAAVIGPTRGVPDSRRSRLAGQGDVQPSAVRRDGRSGRPRGAPADDLLQETHRLATDAFGNPPTLAGAFGAERRSALASGSAK